MSDDPIAIEGPAKLTSTYLCWNLGAIHGSDIEVKPITEFKSNVCQSRLAESDWPIRRESPFDFAPDSGLTKGVFDLADA